MVAWSCWQEDDDAKEVNEELPPPSTAVSIFPCKQGAAAAFYRGQYTYQLI